GNCGVAPIISVVVDWTLAQWIALVALAVVLFDGRPVVALEVVEGLSRVHAADRPDRRVSDGVRGVPVGALVADEPVGRLFDGGAPAGRGRQPGHAVVERGAVARRQGG